MSISASDFKIIGSSSLDVAELNSALAYLQYSSIAIDVLKMIFLLAAAALAPTPTKLTLAVALLPSNPPGPATPWYSGQASR